MALFVKESGFWKAAAQVAVKDAGLWKIADKVWIKQSGVWKEAHGAAIELVIASDVSDYNIRDALLAAGWDGVAAISASLDVLAGATVWSSVVHRVYDTASNPSGHQVAYNDDDIACDSVAQASAPALCTGGLGGLVDLDITVGGTVVGPGGEGGQGDYDFKGGANYGVPPGLGGTAIKVEDPCRIEILPSGVIGGGGDGGDGGAWTGASSYGAGGGGGAGFGTSGMSNGLIAPFYKHRSADAGATTPGAAAPLSGYPGGLTYSQLGSPGNPLGDGPAIDGFAHVALTNNGTLLGGLVG